MNPVLHVAEPDIIECQEQRAIEVPLAEVLDESGGLAVLSEVQNYFSVRYESKRVTLTAGGHIGLIPLTADRAVFVRPRAPVSNLTHIVSKSGEPPTALPILRMYESHREWDSGVGLILADAMARAAEQILFQGYLRRYEVREAFSSMPRGRVVMDSRLLQRRARGIAYQVPTRWFEQTDELPENQCIKDALRLAIRDVPRTGRDNPQLRRRLNACYRAFEHIRDDPQRRFLVAPMVNDPSLVPPSRDAYVDGLTYAKAIINRHSVAHEAGTRIRLPSLVLNMSNVFERYVRSVLQVAATDGSKPYTVLDGNREGKRRLFQDSTDTRSATPDVVIGRTNEQARVVLEVKNVLEHSGKKVHPFIEQAVTYGVCYQVPDVVIVQPRSAASHHRLATFGRIGDIRVHAYRFDLAATDLQSEEHAFAQAMRNVIEAAPENETPGS